MMTPFRFALHMIEPSGVSCPIKVRGCGLHAEPQKSTVDCGGVDDERLSMVRDDNVERCSQIPASSIHADICRDIPGDVHVS